MSRLADSAFAKNTEKKNERMKRNRRETEGYTNNILYLIVYDSVLFVRIRNFETRLFQRTYLNVESQGIEKVRGFIVSMVN